MLTLNKIKNLGKNTISKVRNNLYDRYFLAQKRTDISEVKKIGKLIDALEKKFLSLKQSSQVKNKANLNEKGLYVSKTNSKLKKSLITAFSLPEICSCPFAGVCKGFCYSPKASRLYKEVSRQRHSNWEASKNDGFIENMTEFYKNEIWNLHRIHADGDFYNRHYVTKWLEIVANCPEKKFYAYTKSFLYFDLDMLPSNLLIIQSEGSTVDNKIDYTKPHARIFKNKEELEKAGYHDCSVYDHEVFNAGIKIGLIFH